MSNKSKNQKFALQETETVTEFQTGESNKTKIHLYLTFLAAVAILSPFLHVFYLFNETEGIFGFSFMSSFLFAISLPLMAIATGLLLKFASTKLPTNLGFAFNYISNSLLFLGFFFLSYTFIPVIDLPVIVYFSSVAILSIILTVCTHYFHKAILTTEQRLKKIISKLFDFIILETPRKHVSEEKQIDYVISYEKIINEIGEE
jgi:hypothetical protein